MNKYVEHFRDLEVYKKQRFLARKVFRLSKSFPKEEKYSLTDQIRRSSRLYPKHFISKLTDADGEQLETQHWLIEAYDCEYISREDQEELTKVCEEIGKMLGSMIRKANSFTSSSYTLKEEPPPYLASPDDN